MTEIEGGGPGPVGQGGGDGRGGGERLYAYRVRGRERGAVVLWVGGRGDAPDRVFALPAVGHRCLPVFVTARRARTYADRRGRALAAHEVGLLDLARVQHWLDDPVGRAVPPGAVLEAWNFFEDLARGLAATARLPRQEATHDNAYEKLFAGQCSTWTPEEERAVRELLAAGVDLWNSCPVVVNPLATPRTRAVVRGAAATPGAG
ncbi:hypothetical protein OS965_10000 [Streptomyces sp. H27-G5]|uniref:hypothetical protein n=1 Tax=Streptomyces sp. H27-G5 TaxID=2996698 RepID=UPI00226E0FE0|nr:hypothetical protein [Streptomyces sp. H27-G5]MCY0918505.1 hypothetical protein [Streptomyces sp. H27-G5]